MKSTWFLLALILSPGVTYPMDASAGQPSKDPPVSLGTSSPRYLVAGTADTLWISVLIAEGFHVQANPAADSFLVPLTLELDPDAGMEIGSPRYPEPLRYRLNGATEDLLTYTGTVRIGLPVIPGPGAGTGPGSLKGRILYQACTDRRCLAPARLPIELRIEVVAPGWITPHEGP